MEEALISFENTQISLGTEIEKRNSEIENLKYHLEMYKKNEAHYRMIIRLYHTKFERHAKKFGNSNLLN